MYDIGIQRRENMNKNVKKESQRGIKNKYLYFKSNIKEKLGEQNLKRIKISLKVLNFIFAIIGFVASVITIVSLFVKSDDSIAIDNYQKGIIYLEDDDFAQAQQCFEKAYEIDNELLDIKFYYAYTEYKLANYDKSYQILKENRNRLSENELAFYSMYEYSKGNYEKSREYLNKIRQPENLEVTSFLHYIVTSTELDFNYNYNEGVNTLYANMVLLDAKINEIQQLPDAIRQFMGAEPEQLEGANEVIIRINDNVREDVLILNRCKLIACMQYISHSIQYEEYVNPLYFFEESAELVDFVNNYYVSRKYIEVLTIFALAAVYEPQPIEIEESYKTIVEKYKNILLVESQEGIEIFEEDDRELLEACEAILLDLENDCLDTNKAKYQLDFSSFGVEVENYNIEYIVKLWAEAFLNELYIYNLI